MQCDDKERFATKLKNIEQSQEIQIVYSGTLAFGRWRSLVQLAEAAERLRPEGLEIEIIAYAPFVPVEAGDMFQKLPLLLVRSALADDEVPRVLSAADILFLPESFDDANRSFIKLSVSTKAHLYMMSGRPPLVYGPPEVGTIDYARREGWGYVVDLEGIEPLMEALRRLITERDMCEALVQRGKDISQRNHEGKTVRERLRHDLLETTLTWQRSKHFEI
jgi:glycosyltransferase involved in cell wall biosynthesis